MSGPEPKGVRERVHEVIFEADTPGGKAFDVVLLLAILASVVAVMLESVAWIRSDHGTVLAAFEWVITIAFTLEYGLRLWSVRRPGVYARSFFGIVDLLAILPTYVSLVLPGAQGLAIIRALRLLRVFRVLKLVQFLRASTTLSVALKASAPKIIVFLGAVLTVVLICGSSMYLVEGAEHGFTSIPISVYWAIVTMTTVGYGDIAPGTVPGQFIAAALMITGYGVIAVPTGIVSVELARSEPAEVTTRACPGCGAQGHDTNARNCKFCGEPL